MARSREQRTYLRRDVVGDALVDLPHAVLALAVGLLLGDDLEDGHAEGVDVDPLVVVLLEQLRRHEGRRAHAPGGLGWVGLGGV